MRLPDSVWWQVVDFLLPRCAFCRCRCCPRDPCGPGHCARCCYTRSCVTHWLGPGARASSPRVQDVVCLQCTAEIGFGDLHWVHDGEGMYGYSSLCPRCAATEELLLPLSLAPACVRGRRFLAQRFVI